MNSKNRPVIVHVVHSLEGGGTERTLVKLLRAFDPKRFRHAVVTLRAAGPLTAQLPDHVACRALAIQGRSRRAGLRLAAIMREWGAALIHARNTGCWHDAIVAGMLTPQARLVLGFHGLETTRGFNRRQRHVALCGRLAGGRFTSVSESGRLQLHRQTRVPTDRIDLLPNGVDLRRFDRSDQHSRRRMRDELQLDDATFVVGTVGALTPVKQHTTLIAAAARVSEMLPNLRLLIVGDGPLRASLIDQARLAGLGDRVRFLGWREDVPALLGCMDAYVCGSASEGMSNALLEAMAAGLPIIATNVGDNAMLVRNDVEGCIVMPNAPAAIAEALRFLAGMPAIRARYAAAARVRAGRYDFGRAVRAYEAYYRALLGTGSTIPARSINRTCCTVTS